MNQSQWMSLIRSAGLFLGGILVARGVLNDTQLADLIDRISRAIPLVMTAATALYSLGLTLWGLFNHTDRSKISAVTAMPGVKSIVVKAAAPANSAASMAANDDNQP